MKRSFKILALLAGVSMLALACNDDVKDDVTPEGPGEEVTISVSPTSLSFDASSSAQTITITTTEAWEAATDASWISIDPAAGTADASVTVAVEANESLVSRSGNITVSDASGSVTVTVSQESGSTPGTNGTVTISSADELAAVLASATYLARTDVTWKLGADIDFGGSTVSPAVATFTGVLDGDGHSIKSANFTAPMIGQNDGTIQNIKFESATIKTGLIGTSNGTVSGVSIDANSTYTFDAQTTSANLGAVVGTNNGTVSNCSSAAVSNITITGFEAACNVGGVVGASYGLVDGCSFSGTLSLNQTAPTKSIYNTIAGVVGLASGNSGEVIVKDCSNTGSVSVTFATAVYFNTAGVVGSTDFVKQSESTPTNQGIISGCSNTGAISMRYVNGGSGAYPMCGGVCGTIDGYLQDCENSGSISLTCESTSSTWTCISAGGVAGTVTFGAKNLTNKSGASISVSALVAGGTAGAKGAGNIETSAIGGVIAKAGPYTADNTIVFEDCKNEADLDITLNSITATPNHHAGAVFGYASGKISNCSNSGSFKFTSPVGYMRVAGIAGGTKCDVDGCTNTGTITADSATFSASATGSTAPPQTGKYAIYASGIVGCTRLATAVNITNCTNSGQIVGIMEAQDIASIYKSYVTGILACNGVASAAESNATITGCTNSGTLTDSSTDNQTVITADMEGGRYQDPV